MTADRRAWVYTALRNAGLTADQAEGVVAAMFDEHPDARKQAAAAQQAKVEAKTEADAKAVEDKAEEPKSVRGK